MVPEFLQYPLFLYASTVVTEYVPDVYVDVDDVTWKLLAGLFVGLAGAGATVIAEPEPPVRVVVIVHPFALKLVVRQLAGTVVLE